MKIFWHFRSNTDLSVVRAVIPSPALRHPDMQAYRPRYVPARKRMSQGDAEEIINRSFPGISFPYLRLLIAARGCAEGEVGQPPRIAVDGPSGAGKDMTVRVAACLLGEGHRNVPWNLDVKEFHLALHVAAQNAGLVTSSEIIKMIKAKRGEVLASLSALLTFERGTSVRVPYIGPVEARQVPVVIITDTSFPRELHCDMQMGRRFVYVHLERTVDWQRTAQFGLESWRAAKPEHADAANAFVSHVIDEFFAGDTPVVFEDIARELGFELLNRSGDMGLDPRDDLLALFRACCSSQAVTASCTTWKGRGWRLIQRMASDPVSLAWQAVCDNQHEGFTTSRRVKEADWARLLDVEQVVECDISPDGNTTLAIRFRCGKSRSPQVRFNEEIQRRSPPPEPPTPPSEPPPDRPPSSGDPPSSPAPTDPGPAIRGESPVLLARTIAPESPPMERGASSSMLAPVFIDLETRSRCNLQQQGGRRYAEHPSTEILTVAALIDDRIIAWTPTLQEPLPADQLGLQELHPDSRVETFAGLALPPLLADAISEGRPFCAHNAFGFDARVWNARGLPPPSAWLDSLPHARAAGLPGKLEELCQWLFGVGKEKEGQQLIRKLCQPNQQGDFIPFNRQNALALMKYNIIDTVLLARLYPVVRGCAEPEVVALDQTINNRGVAFDVELARALIELEAQGARTACNEVEQLTQGAIKATDLRKDKLIKDWLKSQGVVLPDLRRETVQQYLHNQVEFDPALRRVLEVRLCVNRVTAGKLENAVAACGPDHRLRDLLIYHKAHTGRWSGCGVQPHNLPRPHQDLKALDPLVDPVHDLEQFRQALPPTVSLADAVSALIRPCFRAAPKKVLVIADFASIEARGVAWCANESTLLELFAQGGDAYCDLAAKIFGRPVTKAMKGERGVGKEAVLGCGYGMGPVRFAKTCQSRGIDLGAASITAEAVVESYRDAYPAIAGVAVGCGGQAWRTGGLWQEIEATARDAIDRGVLCSAGRCEFFREDNVLVIRLPSGRRLYYRNARIEERVPAYCSTLGLPPTTKPTIVYDEPDERGVSTYGGKLTENIVQAICRDLLVAGMLECERQGLPVVMHVHDEVVVEVPGDRAEQSLRQFVAGMSRPPAWAAGFPIEVEGFASERYGKTPPQGGKIIKARNGMVLEPD